MKSYPKGTRVRVQTINGGEAVVTLAEDWTESYGLVAEEFRLPILGWRITDVTPTEPVFAYRGPVPINSR